ncbi:hypothetical protein [Deinococcus cellulosilyticus]|nr:hypothetical protein [Deinococcus cellulosilyticus]
MKLLVVFLVSFLLGVTVRALWIMAFPLDVTSEMLNRTSMNITELTFRTLMSMLWTGALVGLTASGLMGAFLGCKVLLSRRSTPKKSLPEA